MTIGWLPRLVVAVLLGGAIMPFPLAAAASTDAGAPAEAWYWRPQTPSAVPARLPPLDAEGLLPVAVTAGEPHKIALLAIDPGDPGATSVQVSLMLDTRPGAEVNAADVALRACLVTAGWTPVVAGRWEELPSYDCDTGAEVEVGGDSAPRVARADLSAHVAAWSTGVPNHGIAIVPDPDRSRGATWQVSVRGITLGGVEVRSSGAPPELMPTETPNSGTAAPPSPRAPEFPELVLHTPTPAPVRSPAPASSAATPASPAGRPIMPAEGRGAVVIAALPFERALEVAAAVAAILLAAIVGAAAAVGTGDRSSRGRYLGAGVSAWCLAGGAVLLAWSGAARQPVVWAQVPYLASGALAAVLLVLIGCALVIASAAVALPAGHPLIRVVRRLRAIQQPSKDVAL